jgi:exodeoxyribonuclease VII small subunit
MTSASQSTPSFESARQELASIVAQLESGGTTLEEAVQLWQRGEELAGICQVCLDEAAQEVAESDSPPATD